MALRKLTWRTGFRTGAAYRLLLGAKAKKDYDESPFRFSFLFEHDLSENRYPLFGIML
jgi:hypothetical protein